MFIDHSWLANTSQYISDKNFCHFIIIGRIPIPHLTPFQMIEHFEMNLPGKTPESQNYPKSQIEFLHPI
jgi:hypothetical protein